MRKCRVIENCDTANFPLKFGFMSLALLMGGAALAFDAYTAADAPKWFAPKSGLEGKINCRMQPIEGAAQPSGLAWYPAPQPNGTTVVVCPGGGYGWLASDYEGEMVAKWLNTIGVNAAVIDYPVSKYAKTPLLDGPVRTALAAIRSVRANADGKRIRADRVGVCGFSAGGHLAASASNLWKDRAERPDFSVLIYPVIDFSIAPSHNGTPRSLTGLDAGSGKNPELTKSWSMNHRVTAETPPAFVVTTDADTVVPAEHAIRYVLACRSSRVPAELHMFKPYQHGGGLCRGRRGEELWPELCRLWMKNINVLP